MEPFSTENAVISRCYTLRKWQSIPVGQRSDLDVGEPGFHSLEALLHGDIIHHHHAISLAEELLGDAAVPVTVTEFDSSPP